MNVSEMQSALARLRNGFNSFKEELPKSQWVHVEKSLSILESNIGKLQKNRDQKYKQDHMRYDLGLETGMEYCGETEVMY